MQKHTLHFYTIISTLTLTVIALAVLGLQQVQAAFSKAAAEGQDLRITETNTCTEKADTDTVHFSGCNSII